MRCGCTCQYVLGSRASHFMYSNSLLGAEESHTSCSPRGEQWPKYAGCEHTLAAATQPLTSHEDSLDTFLYLVCWDRLCLSTLFSSHKIFYISITGSAKWEGQRECVSVRACVCVCQDCLRLQMQMQSNPNSVDE